jgi:transcriptional regulator with XRE-family HTH domain
LVGNKEKDNAVFGRLVREARLESGKSAQEVADAAGVTPAFVRAVERGKQAPSKESGRLILTAVKLLAQDVAPRAPGSDLVIQDPKTGSRGGSVQGVAPR